VPDLGERRTNPLTQLPAYGQSIWMDDLSRHIVKTGELKRLVDEDGVTGLTSNPTIFEKAIDGSADYDEGVRQLGRRFRH
jgi:transaldolase